MSNRKRVNISIDPETYEKLQQLKQAYGFSNACELVVAFVHILIDRLKKAEDRRYDMPEDDGEYIDRMFDNLGNCENTPANTAPPKQRRNGKG